MGKYYLLNTKLVLYKDELKKWNGAFHLYLTIKR